MQRPPIPVDEAERLADLRRLDLLLTTPEEPFDSVTRELARIFDVPGVAMSFIDEDTQYHKSAVGLPPELAATRTEPRELSVCSFVVGTNEMLVVEDLLADERFLDNPIVIESGARFYAGAPLRATSGRAVGSLCIVDSRPRSLTPRERELLLLVAQGVMAHVHLQVASRQLLQRTRKIERDLEQAVEVQRFLLPPRRVDGAGWRVCNLYRPVEHLGGDFLDLHVRPDGRVCILVADVSGHGTSAALTGAMTKTAFLRAAPSTQSPQGLLTAIQRELFGMVPPGSFMTALTAVIDPSRREVTLASAGHPPPLRVKAGKAQVVDLETELVLLVEGDLRYTQQTLVTLDPSERLLLYTDGAVEARIPRGALLGTEGLMRHAGGLADREPEVFLEELMKRIAAHAENQLRDDIALLTIELT